ncbi:MAG: hypothetical protein HC888_01320 [Candidatus Competibacteraceae bacterium]|nr:hypothetical protein [Candidatus Competibacteraceae bacterium]
MADIEGLIPYYKAAQGESDLTPGQWHLNYAIRHAVRLFGDYDALNETHQTLVPEGTQPETLLLNSFADQAVATFSQTKAVADEFGGEDVELDLQDRILSLVLDHSGSQTWNDNKGMRYAVAKRLINRVSSTYPGDIAYNLVTFGGRPVNVTLFAVLETDEINSNDVQSVSASFFQEEVARFAGIRIVRKEGSYPTSAIDGEVVSEGFFSKSFDDQLDEGTTYYYKVFTYDKDFNFSPGVPIYITPRNRDIPRGVARVDSEVLKGSGVRRDENTLGVWHFDEAAGNILYDFSGNRDLKILDETPIWLPLKEVPVGKSALRMDGRSSGATAEDDENKLDVGSSGTIMFWLYPYDFNDNRMIVARQNGAGAEYSVVVNTSGGLTFTRGTSSAASTSWVLEPKAWNHCAVTFGPGGVGFRVNGVAAGANLIVAPSSWATGDKHFDIGFDRQGVLETLFGKLKEVSVHDVERDASYIIEQSLVDDSDDLGGIAPARRDNGDRLLIIQYQVPDDYNYEGGSVEIIKKELSAPTWEGDGQTFASKPASPGVFYITDPDDFVLGETYYYRLWSKNAIGNYSFIEDAPLVSASIPPFSQVEQDGNPSDRPLPVSGLAAIPGNKKVYLKWNNPVIDPLAVRVRVFRDTSGFPVVQDSSAGSGNAIFAGTLDDEELIDLFENDEYLTNGKTYFYTVVTVDRFGTVSNPINVQATPSATAVETGIPLLDVSDIGYEIVNDEAVSIRWKNPIEFRSDLKGWFDQRVFIYAAVTDDFGQPISDQTRVRLDVVASVSSAGLSEDVFNDFEVNETLDPQSYYVFGSSRVGPGVVRGTLRLSGDVNRVSQVEKISFQVKLQASVPDIESARDASGNYADNLFEFYSEGISIELDNPWKMEIINRDGRSVEEECEVDPRNLVLATEVGNELGPEVKTFPGAYIRSKKPWVARVKMSSGTSRSSPIPTSASRHTTLRRVSAATFSCRSVWNQARPCCHPRRRFQWFAASRSIRMEANEKSVMLMCRSRCPASRRCRCSTPKQSITATVRPRHNSYCSKTF